MKETLLTTSFISALSSLCTSHWFHVTGVKWNYLRGNESTWLSISEVKGGGGGDWLIVWSNNLVNLVLVFLFFPIMWSDFVWYPFNKLKVKLRSRFFFFLAASRCGVCLTVANVPLSLQPLGRLLSLPIIQIPRRPPTNILYTSTSVLRCPTTAPHSFPFSLIGICGRWCLSPRSFRKGVRKGGGGNLTDNRTTIGVKTESCPCLSMFLSTSAKEERKKRYVDQTSTARGETSRDCQVIMKGKKEKIRSVQGDWALTHTHAHTHTSSQGFLSLCVPSSSQDIRL